MRKLTGAQYLMSILSGRLARPACPSVQDVTIYRFISTTRGSTTKAALFEPGNMSNQRPPCAVLGVFTLLKVHSRLCQLHFVLTSNIFLLPAQLTSLPLLCGHSQIFPAAYATAYVAFIVPKIDPGIVDCALSTVAPGAGRYDRVLLVLFFPATRLSIQKCAVNSEGGHATITGPDQPAFSNVTHTLARP